MAGKRIRTLAITMALLLFNVLLGELWYYGVIQNYPVTSRAMLIIGMVHTIGRCMLSTFRFKKAAKILSIAGFCMLCGCVFYATCWLDYVLFAAMMWLLLHRVNIDCECSCDVSDAQT